MLSKMILEYFIVGGWFQYFRKKNINLISDIFVKWLVTLNHCKLNLEIIRLLSKMICSEVPSSRNWINGSFFILFGKWLKCLILLTIRPLKIISSVLRISMQILFCYLGLYPDDYIISTWVVLHFCLE